MSNLIDLGNDIYLVENLLEVAVCQHLIEITQCYPLQNAAIEVAKVDAQVRNNSSLKLGGTNSLLHSTNELLLSKINVVQKLLQQQYGVAFPYAETCTILRYQPGQYYQRHVDNLLLAHRFDEAAQGIPTRDISLVGYLNDDFDGEETYFDRQNLKVTPQQGSVLVFPAYYTHPHASLPIRSGVKYAFTSWLFH